MVTYLSLCKVHLPGTDTGLPSRHKAAQNPDAPGGLLNECMIGTSWVGGLRFLGLRKEAGADSWLSAFTQLQPLWREERTNASACSMLCNFPVV